MCPDKLTHCSTLCSAYVGTDINPYSATYYSFSIAATHNSTIYATNVSSIKDTFNSA